jgi:hypothetical protein
MKYTEVTTSATRGAFPTTTGAKGRLSGFWAGVLKFVMPKISEIDFLNVAEWAVELWLRAAIENPERRESVINLARDYHRQVGDFIDWIDADTDLSAYDVLR